MSHVAFRRKREGKTNYKTRLELLKGNKPRLVARRSLKNITAQIVQYTHDGDKVVVGVSSKSLEKLGWKADRSNIPAAYLTGFMLGKNAIKAGISEAVLDMGFFPSIKGNRIFAVLRGAIDAGLKIPHSATVLPSDDAVNGKLIAAYAAALAKDNKEKYAKVFSGYIKKGIKGEDLPKHVSAVKAKL